MNKTINYPVTFRDLVQDAMKLGRSPSEHLAKLEKKLGPIPRPPAGYTLAEDSDDRWIGGEIMNRNWIITSAWTWNSTGGAHSLELWMANNKPPTYAHLSLAEAFDLAGDLITAARAIGSAGANVTSTAGGTN